jgi:hypothetical protein
MGGSASGGGLSSPYAHAFSPNIIIDQNNDPIVSWVEILSNNEPAIYLRRFNGNQWTEFSEGSASGTGIGKSGNINDSAALAFSPNGSLYIAYATPDQYIAVKRFDGQQWVDLSSNSDLNEGVSKGSAVTPGLTVDSYNDPIVMWTARITSTNTITSQIYLK